MNSNWIRAGIHLALLAALTAGLGIACQSAKKTAVRDDLVTCPQCTAEPKAPYSHDLVVSTHRCPACKTRKVPVGAPTTVAPQQPTVAQHTCTACGQNASACALCNPPPW